jgi:hypothetical protein
MLKSGVSYEEYHFVVRENSNIKFNRYRTFGKKFSGNENFDEARFHKTYDVNFVSPPAILRCIKIAYSSYTVHSLFILSYRG